MAHPIRIPEQGSAVESCLITAWLAEEGDAVTEGEPILEIETDKSAFEIEAPADGVLLRTLHREGDEVAVHGLVAIVGDPDEDLGALLAEFEPDAIDGGVDTPPGVDVAIRGAPSPSERPPAESVSAPAVAVKATDPESAAADGAPAVAADSSFSISPRAARLAVSRGIDVRSLVGTGPQGRVLEFDVREAPAGERSGTEPAEEVIRRPLSGVRRTIARRMHASLAESAQLTLTARADASRLRALRERFKTSDPALGLSAVSINDLLLFVVSRTLPDHPGCNAHFSWDGIDEHPAVHLGVAVQTDRGLLVPVIPDADRRTLRELSVHARARAERAREGVVTLEEMSGATFTVTNLGTVGVETFTPVLDPPQVAILGVGAITPMAIETDRGIEHRPGLHLSLTFDHRALDGYGAGRFLQAVCRGIDELDLLLIAEAPTN